MRTATQFARSNRVAATDEVARAGSQDSVYLGTFVFRASNRARGTFDIVLILRQTTLTESARQRIEIRSAVGTTITVR